MSPETWWGLVVLLWVLAALPMISSLGERLEVPVRLGWIGGLLVLLAAYAMDWNPIVGTIVAAVVTCAITFLAIRRRGG